MISVRCAASRLELPVRPPRKEDESLRPFEPPEAAPGTVHTKLRQLPMRRTIEIDLTTNEMVYTLRSDGGEFGGASLARIEEIDLELGYMLMKRYRILEADPQSAEAELHQKATLRRGDWSVALECRMRLNATAEAFKFTGDLEVHEGSELIERRDWTQAIPRTLL